MSFRIGLSFDKMHFTCSLVDLGWFKSSRNMLFKSRFKAMQICLRNKWKSLTTSSTDCIYWGLKGKFNLMLDSCLTDTLSIEIYENQFFRFDFTHIHVYVFRLSFITTLNIYNDYFKGCHTWCNLKQRFYSSILWPETYALVHLSLMKLPRLYAKEFCN